ncbi:hypothetical protein MHN00_20310 [Alteromonas sp. Cnat2-8]|uniref:hypothetical protein n=1 Tax=Alteromonas sp. Cnat2-8 TaxID=2917728 RepID=UPI001EF5D689|nr:hypothetical protein [Alteromonas sp. Cnat2-8]MCG7655889.1 hypothetical protein [Alteromonas sp. Cnat2-8]
MDALIVKDEISKATITEMEAELALFKDDVKAVCLASSGSNISKNQDILLKDNKSWFVFYALVFAGAIPRLVTLFVTGAHLPFSIIIKGSD